MTAVRLTSTQARIVDALKRGAGSHDQLVDAVWGDDPNGGPLDAPANLKVHICRLRRFGFRIETYHSQGYRLLHDPRVELVEGARWLETA